MYAVVLFLAGSSLDADSQVTKITQTERFFSCAWCPEHVLTVALRVWTAAPLSTGRQSLSLRRVNILWLVIVGTYAVRSLQHLSQLVRSHSLRPLVAFNLSCDVFVLPTYCNIHGSRIFAGKASNECMCVGCAHVWASYFRQYICNFFRLQNRVSLPDKEDPLIRIFIIYTYATAFRQLPNQNHRPWKPRCIHHYHSFISGRQNKVI